MDDILIVGAGPVGLIAAILLTRAGKTVRIIDKNATSTPYSKAIGINPRTLELLECTPLTSRLLNAGIKAKHMYLHVEQKVALSVDLNNIPHPYNFMLLLPQYKTETIFEHYLNELGVAVERDTEFTDFIHVDKHHLEYTINKNNKLEKKQCQIIIGCDGAHSQVRKCLNLSFDGSQYPGHWYLADVSMTSPYPCNEGHIFLETQGQFLLMIPIAENRYRLIGNSENYLSFIPKGTLIETTHWESNFTISERQVKSYQNDCVFLAGDAAHIHSPAGARGMNLGIEDAVILSKMIINKNTKNYSTLRHSVAAKVICDSDALTRLITMKNPILCFIRNQVIFPLLNVPSIQQKLINFISGMKSRKEKMLD